MCHTKKATCKKRKGFSLVELVVVILIIAILAVAVFAGGSAVIKNAQISRTTSDLHNFSVAVESTLNQNPSVANVNNADGLATIAAALAANLPEDYQWVLNDTNGPVTNAQGVVAAAVSTGNMQVAVTDHSLVYKSAKKDAWDNNYYVILDYAERNGNTNSDFFITVVSAGPNARTTVNGAIESDDIFLLGQYTNGNVSAATYNLNDGKTKMLNSAGAALTAKAQGTAGGAMYNSAGSSDATSAAAPVNFSVS